MRPFALMTLPALAAIAALAAFGVATAGDIYCNNQGKECSDRPSPGAVVIRQTPVSGQLQAQGQVASASERPQSPVDAAANDRLREQARAAAVQKDVSAARTEQCKAATDKYQKSVEARRMYRMNKDGEREYFSDQETDAARLSARNEMEQACGKGG
jgi:hypothetical protein